MIPKFFNSSSIFPSETLLCWLSLNYSNTSLALVLGLVNLFTNDAFSLPSGSPSSSSSDSSSWDLGLLPNLVYSTITPTIPRRTNRDNPKITTINP